MEKIYACNWFILLSWYIQKAALLHLQPVLVWKLHCWRQTLHECNRRGPWLLRDVGGITTDIVRGKHCMVYTSTCWNVPLNVLPESTNGVNCVITNSNLLCRPLNYYVTSSKVKGKTSPRLPSPSFSYRLQTKRITHSMHVCTCSDARAQALYNKEHGWCIHESINTTVWSCHTWCHCCRARWQLVILRQPRPGQEQLRPR